MPLKYISAHVYSFCCLQGTVKLPCFSLYHYMSWQLPNSNIFTPDSGTQMMYSYVIGVVSDNSAIKVKIMQSK